MTRPILGRYVRIQSLLQNEAVENCEWQPKEHISEDVLAEYERQYRSSNMPEPIVDGDPVMFTVNFRKSDNSSTAAPTAPGPASAPTPAVAGIVPQQGDDFKKRKLESLDVENRNPKRRTTSCDAGVPETQSATNLGSHSTSNAAGVDTRPSHAPMDTDIGDGAAAGSLQ